MRFCIKIAQQQIQIIVTDPNVPFNPRKQTKIRFDITYQLHYYATTKLSLHFTKSNCMMLLCRRMHRQMQYNSNIQANIFFYMIFWRLKYNRIFYQFTFGQVASAATIQLVTSPTCVRGLFCLCRNEICAICASNWCTPSLLDGLL